MISSYRNLGNTLHVSNMLGMITYSSLLLLYSGEDFNVFDRRFLEAGFCEPREDYGDHTGHLNGTTTQELSGLAIIVLCLLGLIFQRELARNTVHKDALAKAHDKAFWAMMGGIGHGLGHYFIAFVHASGYYPPAGTTFLDDMMASSLSTALIKSVPPLFLLWMPLVKAFWGKLADGWRVVPLACAAWIGSMFMEARFGFAYSLTIVYVGSSLEQLLTASPEEKGFEYCLWPLVTTTPTILLVYAESMACSGNAWMSTYGHVIFDSHQACSFFAFYVICWIRANYTMKTKLL